MKIDNDGFRFSAYMEGEDFHAAKRDVEAKEVYLDRTGYGVLLSADNDGEAAIIQMDVEAMKTLQEELREAILECQ